MSGKPCAVCNKTAYPLESYSINISGVGEKTFHKTCFKCSFEENGKGCSTTVNMKNYKAVDGKVYCVPHAPKPKGSVVTTTLAMQTALNAPKKGGGALGVHKADPRVAPKHSGDFTVNQVGDQSTENAPDQSTITYDQHSGDQSTENNPDQSNVSYDQHPADQSTEN
jgi:hypothetical protein